MNFKFSLICVLILVLIFTSCSKKSETQAAAAIAAASYEKILHGDLSAFTGTWVNSRGEKRQLRANGTFNSGETAYGFKIGNENDQHIAGTNYQWIVNMGGEAGGFEVWLYPADAAIRNYDGDFIETDNTKDRIVIELIGSSDDVYYREGEAPSAQTKTAASSDSYAKFLAGDMSDFAGTWVNGYGWKARLSSAGVFVIEIFGGGANLTAYGFEKTGDSANETYSWYVSSGGESMGDYFTLFPAGTEVMDNSYPRQLIVTDTTKVRIADTAKNIGSSAEVYYREGEAAIKTDAGIPPYIVTYIFRRIEAIENGDIAAFRSTLSEWEDGADYNYQLNILNRFFGDLFGINPAAFNEAISDGTEELSIYADKLFRGSHSPQKRNSGLRIIRITDDSDSFVYRVTTTNNRNEESVINFPYSSF